LQNFGKRENKTDAEKAIYRKSLVLSSNDFQVNHENQFRFKLNVWRFTFIVSGQISNICPNPQQRHLSNIRAIVVPEVRFEQNNRHITTDKSHWSQHKALKALQRDLSTRWQ
jgi:hypothetical protein